MNTTCTATSTKFIRATSRMPRTFRPVTSRIAPMIQTATGTPGNAASR
jgi:hypothetical protein